MNNSEIFHHKLLNPASWFAQAHSLKRAADKICWLDENSEQKDESNCEHAFLYPIYRMLMGLAFENIFKGMIVANGDDVFVNGKLKKSFATHNLIALASRLGLTNTIIGDREMEILKELEKYVNWQGRYPIPKMPECYNNATHGTLEHRIEQELYGKLSQCFEEICYILMPDGSKKYLKDITSA